MILELPCNVGETVFADLKLSRKGEPKFCELTECTVRTIEIDKSWAEPLFTTVRKDFDVCHLDEDDYRTFWLSDFGKYVFTKEQYFKLKG